MRKLFRRLRIEHQIVLLPLLAGIGFLTSLVVVLWLGARGRAELTLLRTGYAESLQSSTALQTMLENYQRTLQNAAAASEPAGLQVADTVAAQIRAHLAESRSNPVADALELDELGARFRDYYELSRDVTARMIEGASNETLRPQLAVMTTRYTRLHTQLAVRTGRDRQRIASAFVNVEQFSRATTATIILLLVIVVSVLSLLAVRIGREVRRALTTIGHAASLIAEGDLRSGIDFSSEVQLAPLAEPFRAIIAYIEDIASAADRLARGDLTVAITPRSYADMAAINLRQAIADRVSMETTLRQSEEHLQSRKMEAIGRLAGGIAHDFNNLLTAVVGHADLLAMSIPAADPAQESVREIRRAGDRAADLTRQLLAYGARQVLQPKLVDLNAMVQEVCQLLRPTIREDIAFRFALDDASGSVRIDPAQLHQVLVNLVLNARDAIAEGGTISIGTATVRLGAGSASGIAPPPGDYVRIRIADDGVGMDATTRARLFEPFFTTKGLANASGLGLATAWGLVRQSGGELRVESQPGEGAVFDIYLPRVEAQANAVAGDPQSTPAGAPSQDDVGPAAGRNVSNLLRSSGGIVLVAEDEPVVRNMVTRLLEQSGLTVLAAADGEAALELARSHAGSIDVLLTDVVMPRMGGRDLAGRLREERPGLRVVYMSGYAEDETLRAGALGDAAFMQKPFDPKILTKTIHAAVRHAGERRMFDADDVVVATDADVELHV